ncbi:MAG TPA: DegT/DnrJ/EryC1/StrS aminotransferase family protein, partial [Telluria sp.]|nr:DegT/DnrJ/EryC1/StrS aminotransferase family protein [Telluria sp.]
FDPAWLDKRSSLFTRAVLRLVPAAGIASQRRANYRKLQAALAGLPGGRPLSDSLPDGACPWVFPWLADDPERVFARLQAGGVPVTRFAHGTDSAGCGASAELSQRVLGLPCHQELSRGELDHMITIIQKALA